MRSLLVIGLLAALPTLAFGQEAKVDSSAIKVVKIDRKDPVTFEKDIYPVLRAKCTVCHSGSQKEGKLDLDSYEGLIKGGKRGASVKPGKPDESLLIVTAGRTGAPKMPPPKEVTQKPLSPEELALFKLWVEQGAKAPTTVIERPKAVVSLPPAGVKPVRALAVSPDKSAVAAGRGNQIHVYDASSGTYIRTLLDPSVMTPDKKPVQAAHLSLVESLAFSPDGKLLASGSYQEVTLWDVQTGAVKQKLTGFADRVVTMAFSNNGQLLATGGGAPTEDGEIKLFEVASGKLVTDIKNGHSDTVFGVSFSPDDKMLATCGADKFVKVFEVPGGKFIKSFEGHTHHVLDVGWKSDGKLLVSGSADNSVKIWDFEKGEQVRTIANAHSKQVTRLVFIGKTPMFLTSSADNTVKKWNVDNGQPQGPNFGGSTDSLYAVGSSADGLIVASGGEEGIVRLYKGDNGQLIKALLPPGEEPAPAPKK
jgi:WD40 repeat protein